jgi:hypothetical protein
MKAFRRLLIASIGAAAFASCTANGGLIYLNIQKTTKTQTGNIPVDITVTEMLATGPGDYYVAAGKIYHGTASAGSSDWSAISVPQANGQDMLCTALSWDGANLWGGFFSPDGSSVGLYERVAGSWTLITGGGAPAGLQITYVKAFAANAVFAVAAKMSGGNFAYQLYFYNGGGWATATFGGASTLSRPITGIGSDGPTNYYATSANVVYSAPIATPTTFTAFFTSTEPNDIFRGVFIDTDFAGGPNTLILVPSSNQTVSSTGVGGVYYSISNYNGGAFSEVTTNAGSSYNVGFLCAAGPVDPEPTYAHVTYLLGADSGYGAGFGFFSLNLSNPASPALNRYNGISYSLYASAVNRILVDTSSANLVAMGTINNGLWVTYAVDQTGGFSSNTWTQE